MSAYIGQMVHYWSPGAKEALPAVVVRRRGHSVTLYVIVNNRAAQNHLVSGVPLWDEDLSDGAAHWKHIDEEDGERDTEYWFE